MDRYEALREQVLPVLLPYGVEEIALFGSVAGEETAQSDLDLLVRFAEPPRRPLSLITWGRLERELGNAAVGGWIWFRRVDSAGISARSWKPTR